MGKELTEEEKPLLTKKQIAKSKQAIANRPTMQSIPLLSKRGKALGKLKKGKGKALAAAAQAGLKGGKVNKRNMGGKVVKVNNDGQKLVQRMYGGKLGF